MNDFQHFLELELFTIGGTTVNVTTLGVGIAVAIVAFVLARVAEKAVTRLLAKRGISDEGSARATARLVHYAVLTAGLAIAVNTVGINLNTLFAAGAFFAIALGFAMQNITQNFVSGLILLTERTIKPNDIIEVEGRMVKVTDMGMRATFVRTWDSEDYIIPNSVLVSNTVKNLTLRDRLHRIRCQVGVTYDSDMAEVRRVLEETAREQPWREPTADPVVLMKQFGSSSVDFDVSVWVDDPFARSLSQSNLNEAVWFALKKAGITIAFPQLDVHLDQPFTEAVRGSRPVE